MKKLKDRIISVVIGFLIGTMMVTSVFALSETVSKNLLYKDIKITLDGNELIPLDANGTYVEPFAIDGTTYLPVRAISNALGLTVGWDQKTSTVILESLKDETAEDVSPAGQVVYNHNGIKISYMGYRQDSENNISIIFGVENNTTVPFEVQAKNESVNGYMIDSVCSFPVAVGKIANIEVGLNADDLARLNITYLNSFETTFYIFDRDTTFECTTTPIEVNIDRTHLIVDRLSYIEYIKDVGTYDYDTEEYSTYIFAESGIIYLTYSKTYDEIFISYTLSEWNNYSFVTLNMSEAFDGALCMWEYSADTSDNNYDIMSGYEGYGSMDLNNDIDYWFEEYEVADTYQTFELTNDEMLIHLSDVKHLRALLLQDAERAFTQKNIPLDISIFEFVQ